MRLLLWNLTLQRNVSTIHSIQSIHCFRFKVKFCPGKELNYRVLFSKWKLVALFTAKHGDTLRRFHLIIKRKCFADKNFPRKPCVLLHYINNSKQSSRPSETRAMSVLTGRHLASSTLHWQHSLQFHRETWHVGERGQDVQCPAGPLHLPPGGGHQATDR